MQATVVSISDKKNPNAPVMIAPSTLVAANPTPSRISEVSTVPKMPVSSIGRLAHVQPCVSDERPKADTK